MEKAILRTLIYADIFDYPLKAWEIHKWLIGRNKCELPDVEEGLRKLVKRGKVIGKNGYYVLSGRNRLFRRREERMVASKQYLQEARWVCRIFKLIPWIRLVGISGNVAMENGGDEDDIDLFVITQKNRLWLTRLMMLFILSLLEKRRKKGDDPKKAAGKFCLNLLIEEDQLEQARKDLYTAHEVLQMMPLWEKNNIYGNFLEANEWVFRFLPNWASGMSQERIEEKGNKNGWKMFDVTEVMVRFLQLRYMGVPQKDERVSNVAAYFHPEDNQPRVLKEFEKQCKKYLG